MKMISFIGRDQSEVIEKLQCVKRRSPLGPLTRRAWEANSEALRVVGGGPARETPSKAVAAG